MNLIPYSHVRAKLAKTMDLVCRDHAPVVITRQHGDAAVLLSLTDYESLTETSYLLRSPKNADRLLKSIQDLQTGRGRKRKIRL